MKQTILIFLLSTAFALFAQLPMPSGAAERKAREQGPVSIRKPEVRGNAIVCGNKTLTVHENGTLTLTVDGESVGRFYYYFSIENQTEDKNYWFGVGESRYFNTAESKFTADANKFQYSGVAKVGGREWDFYHQSVELLENGLIKISGEWNKPPEGMKLGVRTFFFTGDYLTMGGKQLTVNRKTVTIPKVKTQKGNQEFIDIPSASEITAEFFGNEPGKKFTISGTKPTLGSLRGWIPSSGKGITFWLNRGAKSTAFFLDIREGTDEVKSSDTRAGIDFKVIENLTMPDNSGKNLMRNPSFEQGFHGYGFRMAYTGPAQHLKGNIYSLDQNTARFGGTSLRVAALDVQAAGRTPLHGPPVLLEPGKYTFSYYAKADRPGLRITLSPQHINQQGVLRAFPGTQKPVAPDTEWKRYECQFDLGFISPVNAVIGAGIAPAGEEGCIWIDGIQMEKNIHATSFEVPAFEGRLLTSERGNFVDSASTLNARLEITADPNTAGIVSVAIRNFFAEEIFRDRYDFQTDAQGFAKVELPLDGRLGKGLFAVRVDYETNDGRKCFGLHRITILDYMTAKPPLAHLFSETYGAPEAREDFPRILDRWRKVGYGAKSHMKNKDRETWETYRKNGITPLNAFMVMHFKDSETNRFAGFGILKPGSRYDYSFPPGDNPDWLIRDFKHEAGGRVTPEYLAKLEEACRSVAAAFPWIDLWLFSGEIMWKFPAEWWTDAKTEEAATAEFAKILGAFVKGVKAGNPNARVAQEVPANMDPNRGIRETDYLLTACDKLGVRFDVIGIHPYRFSPENPDLDADTQAFFKMLTKHGYHDTPIFWPEMMHWGPYNIPQLGFKSSAWNPGTTWYTGDLSYDIGWTEKLSAAWRARSWLVALKYSDRVFNATSGAWHNNSTLDYDLTPFASHIIPNTLGHLLGDSYFREDIRFAPGIRCYVFEDAQQRPVAAVWSHIERVDNGLADAPWAEADFGTSLEGVYDLMNNPRAFRPGVLKFPATSFPMFFRGQPGTLEQMIKALKSATIISGENIASAAVSAKVVSPTQYMVSLKNFISQEMNGYFNGRAFRLPASGETQFTFSLPQPLSADRIINCRLPGQFELGGKMYQTELSHEAFLCRKVPEDLTFETIQWSRLSSIPLSNFTGKNKETSGSFRVGWNVNGLFLEVDVEDKIFIHEEFAKTRDRWANDCLQVYIDTMADARSRQTQGYDENDYDYAVFPNKSGTSSTIYRYRTVDPQLGLTTQAPPDHTMADDIPSSFTRNAAGYTYRVFFPAKYLLPMRLEKNYTIGFGLFVPNVNDAAAKPRVSSGLTLAPQGKACFNQPHLWPSMLLTD